MERVNPYQAEHYDLEPSRIVGALKQVGWVTWFHAGALPINGCILIRNMTTPHPDLYLEELPIGYVIMALPFATNVLLLFFNVKRETLSRRLAEWVVGK